MANSKQVKKVVKTGKKIAKKVEKSNHKGLIAVLFIIALAALVFLGYEYYVESNSYNEFINSMDSIESSLNIPDSTKTNLTLVDKVNDMDVTWLSNDESVIKNNGEVIQPAYKDGSKRVKLYATFTYSNKTFIYDFISSSLGGDKYVKEFIINVECKEPSDSELASEIINKIFVPEMIDDNIGLTTKAYNDDVKISYVSSNPSIISNTGEFIAPTSDTNVKLTCTVKINEASVSKEFNVLALSDSYIKEIANDDFDSMDENNNYKEIKTSIITYTNAKIVKDPSFDESSLDAAETNSGSNFIKLRSKDGNLGSFITGNIENIKVLKFDYKFDGTQKTENTTLDIYLNETLLDSITVLHREEFLSVEKEINSSGVLKVVHNSGDSERYVLIDNVSITSGITIDEVAASISIDSSINKSMVLPLSTKLGGVIAWSSSEEALTSDGILVKTPDANTKVTLTAVLTYKGETSVQTFEVTIKTSNVSDPLKIYFIDLGVTDLGDTGESILIVYNDIDVLVDAGDLKSSTYTAVKDAVNEYSNDQVLDYVIATHPDSDHIGNMANVFADFQVNNLIKFYGEYGTQKFKNMKAAYEAEPNCNVYDIYDIVTNNNKEDDYIYLSSDIYIKFLDTKHYQDPESNGKSIVFLLNAYGTTVLMTGDADNMTPHSDLEASYQNQVGDIDILKVVHHGTGNGSSLSYLEAIKPEVAIICNGNYLGNKHGHPHPTAISNLYSCNTIKHVYAITGGGLHCELQSSGAWKGQTTLEESLTDRNGTIILTIDNTGYSFYANYTHENLIDLNETTYWKTYQAR